MSTPGVFIGAWVRIEYLPDPRRFKLFAPFYPGMALAPDWALGVLFGLGGFGGMYLGARAQKHVPARVIKAILCGCVLFVAAKYGLDIFNLNCSRSFDKSLQERIVVTT